MKNKHDTKRTGNDMQPRLRARDGIVLRLSLVACILFGATDSACAMQSGMSPSEAPQSYRAECGDCHVAFAPDLLTANAWQRIMNGLTQHFGVDASIDAKERVEIGSFLVRNAGIRCG
jgi:hypothetical protein